MSKSDLQNPAFHDEDKAREALEASAGPMALTAPIAAMPIRTRSRRVKARRTPSRPVLLRRLQRPVHRHGRHRFRAQQDSADQVAAGHAPHGARRKASARISYSACSASPTRPLGSCAPHPRSNGAGKARRPLGRRRQDSGGRRNLFGGKEKNKHVGKRRKGNIGGKASRPSLPSLSAVACRTRFTLPRSPATCAPIVTHAAASQPLMTDEGGQYFHVGKEFADMRR